MTMSIISNDIIKTASLTASTTAAGYSVNNLKNDKKSSVWRSTTITGQVITAIFANSQASAVGIAFANLIANSTIRVQFFTDTGGLTQVADSGVITISAAHPPPAGFVSNNAPSFAFGGGNHFFVDLGATYTIRRIDVTLNNPGGGTDAYLDVCRIVAGVASKLGYGMDFGSEVVVNDLSLTGRTDSGDLIINRRAASKSISIDLSLMTPADRSVMRAIQRANSIHTPVFISAHEASANALTKLDYRIYGHFEDFGGIVLDSHAHSSMSLIVSEI
jgi:hypothetical protein